ncbi:uncharacterized protein RCC_08748 [Ramularia collo-cygni]|uniref:Uncharacterized protein n=1 Tax=Ramularia collo-cygni TaxID=112498 RepID=A0A2D3VMY7_9PEZI|nr:uncharacterized protein RCC_08748 [Ramularia collo-cygni]CZT23038.1 uncharacterized protein RCC_08748 [Ramularia collo-cygni]
MPGLGGGLKDGYLHDGAFQVKDPATGLSKTIFILSTGLVENTIMLKQTEHPEEKQILRCRNLVHFCKSDLSDEKEKELFRDWRNTSPNVHTWHRESSIFSPESRFSIRSSNNNILEDFVIEMGSLLGLLYGSALNLASFSPDPIVGSPSNNFNPKERFAIPILPIAERVANICAYSQYYVRQDVVLPRIADGFDRTDRFWSTVQAECLAICYIGKRLRSRDLYFDAVRHIVGRIFNHTHYTWDHTFDQNDPPGPSMASALRSLEMSQDEFWATYGPQFNRLEIVSKRLMRDLPPLQVAPRPSGGGPYRRSNHLAKSMRWNDSRSWSPTGVIWSYSPPHVLGGALARDIWGQQFADAGSRIMVRAYKMWKTDNDDQVKELKNQTRWLWHQAVDNEGIDFWDSFTEVVTSIVRECRRSIDLNFPTAEFEDAHAAKDSDGIGFWTCLTLNHDDVPWEKDFEGGGPVAADFVAASKEWLHLVRMA